MSNRDVEQHVVSLLAPIGGEAAYDHVIYCLSPGTTTGADGTGNKNWVAYAVLNDRRSIYNDRRCGLLSPTMHEIGHNLGLHHASEYGWEYEDLTGNMGGVSYFTYAPRQCYNAHKNWHLGWYEDRSIDLSSSIRQKALGFRLVPFVDYNATTVDDSVVIRLGTLYVQYNRNRDFNDGTREYRNHVVIVSATNSVNPVRSNLEAAIALDINGAYVDNRPKPTFAYPNYEGTGFDLVFEVCDQIYGGLTNYVHLSIHLDNGIYRSTCNVPLSVTTASPTMSPTITPQPSSSPSGVLSTSPTLDCTGMDQPGLVAVSNGLGNRTCAWIAAQPGWKKFLCQEGYEAFEQCQETCNSCNDQVPEPANDTCEDSRKMVYINERVGYLRCFWLARFLERQRSPHWKDKLCAPDQEAYTACPETCGACTDACEDQTGYYFYVKDAKIVLGWRHVPCGKLSYALKVTPPTSVAMKYVNTCP